MINRQVHTILYLCPISIIIFYKLPLRNTRLYGILWCPFHNIHKTRRDLYHSIKSCDPEITWLINTSFEHNSEIEDNKWSDISVKRDTTMIRGMKMLYIVWSHATSHIIKDVRNTFGQFDLEPEFWQDFSYYHNLFSFKLTWVDRTHFNTPENVYLSKIGWKLKLNLVKVISNANLTSVWEN